jgi:hypothetical protein
VADYSAAELLTIREWVGSAPNDAALNAYHDGHNGDPFATALSVLRARRADIAANPTQQQWTGDYSESWGKNLDALDAQIGEVSGLVTDPTMLATITAGIQVGGLTRSDRAVRGHTHISDTLVALDAET